MKIIFDFDHTLFSVDEFYKNFQGSFKKIGINQVLFKETFEEAKRGKQPYNPENQFKLIVQKKSDASLKGLRSNFEKILNKANKFLYSDVEPFLKKVCNKFDLYLVSYGDKNFQKKKIEKSGITKFFKKIVITTDINKSSTLKKFLRKNEKAVFVDDNPEALSTTKEKFPQVITIRMNRGEGKYKKEKNNKNIDFCVKNLKEIEKILSKI